MENGENSPSSSIDSSSDPSHFAELSSFQFAKEDLSTDLRLGFSHSASQYIHINPREQLPDWPPIKPLLRTALAERETYKIHKKTGRLFIKVYMEGIPIGRKLDLLTQNCYQSLIKTLQRMFKTRIISPELAQIPLCKTNVLIYEDKEGDWMMVGDVPWKIFLTTVKKLKITRASKC